MSPWILLWVPVFAGFLSLIAARVIESARRKAAGRFTLAAGSATVASTAGLVVLGGLGRTLVLLRADALVPWTVLVSGLVLAVFSHSLAIAWVSVAQRLRESLEGDLDAASRAMSWGFRAVGAFWVLLAIVVLV